MATLRSFGFGKRNIEDRIMGEIRFLLEDFKLKNGQPFDPKTILRSSVSNVITSIVFGKRFEYDDRKMAEVFKLLDSVGSSIYFVLLVVFPFLRHLPVDLFGTQRIQQNLENRRDFLKIMYREHLETYEEGVVRDFVDAYIHKMKQEAEAGNKDCFTGEIFSLLLAHTFGFSKESWVPLVAMTLVFVIVTCTKNMPK